MAELAHGMGVIWVRIPAGPFFIWGNSLGVK